MPEVIDQAGNWIVVASEDCRHCGERSKLFHPAGVVPGRWTCGRCGRSQMEGTSTSNSGTEFTLPGGQPTGIREVEA